jgi:DNA repair exonuclease SbcCD nuclease subunit
MLKLLLIGDPHFKVSNVEDTNQMHENIVKIALNLKPDKIIVLGDVLDRHESIHVSPLKRATKFLQDLLEISPLVILIGNHDRPNNSVFLTEDSPFLSMKKWPNTIIADVPIEEKINNHTLVYVPYVPPGRFIEALEKYKINYQKSTLIFAHQEFKGAQIGHVLSTEGDEWNQNYPQVYSGHIHDYQRLNNNITYTGTPMQHKYGENINKTISLITIGDTITEQRILTNVTSKVCYSIKYSEIDTFSVPDINAKVRITIKCDSSEIKSISKNKKVKEWKKNKIIVVTKYEKTEIITKKPLNSQIKFLDSLKDYVNKDPRQTSWIDKLFVQ